MLVDIFMLSISLLGAAIAFYLKELVQTIKKLSETVLDIRLMITTHEQKLKDTDRRLEDLEK